MILGYRSHPHTDASFPWPQRLKCLPFRPELILRLLSGDKTQTRRPARPRPPTMEAVHKLNGADPYSWRPPTPKWPKWSVIGGVWAVRQLMGQEPDLACPYGGPGSTLWVKEALYRDEDSFVRRSADHTLVRVDGRPVNWTWKPRRLGAMYCPRWASRMTLTLTMVRLDPLWWIDEVDAKAEGVEPRPPPESEYYCEQHDATTCGCVVPTAYYTLGFEDVWREIHGDESWSPEEWVWALTFTTVKS